MSRTPEKTKSIKQQLNRLNRRRKPRANRRNFRRRNLVLGTIFGTGISWGLFYIPLECPKVYLAFDYQPNTVEVDIQFRLTLKEARYCESAQETNNHIE